MEFNLNIENINYIKIKYTDKEGFKHCIKSAIKNINEKEILSCTKYEIFINITYPQDAELDIATDSGLYKAHTTINYTKKEGDFIYIALKTPLAMDFQQNREYFRIKIKEKALLKYYDDKKLFAFDCETNDISANGVKLTLEKLLNIPTKVSITLFFPSRVIETNANYIRTEEEEGLYKASFSFSNIKESDMNFISQVCIQKQLEEKRKTLL